MSQNTPLQEMPQNISHLEQNKFKFIVPNMPFGHYFCQDVTLPDVSTSVAEMPTPLLVNKHHGDRLVYGELIISAILDEDLRVYEETYKWLQKLTTPQKFSQYDDARLTKTGGLYTDAILEFHKNSNLSNVRFKFRNCAPISMGGIPMSHAVSDPETLTCDIVMSYDDFIIERI